MELKDLKNIKLSLRDFAVDVVKYQNFKPKAAIPNLRGEYKEACKYNMFYAGVNYIKYGIKTRAASEKLYEYIDEARNKYIQPLTPSASDKRKFKKECYNTNTCIHPAKLAIQRIREEAEAETIYGVMLNEKVNICKDRAEAEAFIKMAKLMYSETKARLVTINEVKN